jgi:hypothetical protein
MSAIVLKSKPGIGSATTQTGIPMQWSKAWFQSFVNSQLRGADVRNAVGAGGIVVSGNIASPYATITLGPTIPASLTFTGNETFSPVSGNPTTVNAPTTGGNTAVIEYLQGPSGGGYIQFNIEGGATEGYVGYGAATFTGAAAGDFGIAAAAGNLRFSTNGGTSTQMELTTAGQLVLSAGGLTIASATLLTSTVALTNGAGASAGTLTNAPAAGNPTKWIPIVDNGTTRYIPTWT